MVSIGLISVPPKHKHVTNIAKLITEINLSRLSSIPYMVTVTRIGDKEGTIPIPSPRWIYKWRYWSKAQIPSTSSWWRCWCKAQIPPSTSILSWWNKWSAAQILLSFVRQEAQIPSTHGLSWWRYWRKAQIPSPSLLFWWTKSSTAQICAPFVRQEAQAPSTFWLTLSDYGTKEEIRFIFQLWDKRLRILTPADYFDDSH